MSTSGTSVDDAVVGSDIVEKMTIANTSVDGATAGSAVVGSAKTGDGSRGDAASAIPVADGSHSQDQSASSSDANGAMPLPAAMGYCARRLIEALHGTQDAGAQAALDALTASTRELLAWWFGHGACQRRHRNFHQGQREAIVHTILAHELFDSDDPKILFRAACSAWPSEAYRAFPTRACAMSDAPLPAAPAHYRLRMVSGAGGRWVLQALLLWQWAGATTDRRTTGVGIGAHFDARFTLLTANRATAQRFDRALFGMRADNGAFDPSNSSVLRHADLFLPPHLRATFAHWLATCNSATNSPLRIDVLDDTRHDVMRSARSEDRHVSARLVVGDHARAHAQDTYRSCNVADVSEDNRSSRDALAQRRDAYPNAMRANASHSLWIDLDHSRDAPPAGAAVLADLPLLRALRIGAVKSLLLVDLGFRNGTQTRHRHDAVKPRHRGMRPVLPRRERPMIDAGVRVLETIERDTRTLRAHCRIDAPPALLVLCEVEHMHRAVVAYLRQRGIPRDAIVVCTAQNIEAQLHARIVVDTLPARHATMQSRYCAVVLLHDGAPRESGADLSAQLWPALAPHWHDPSIAETKAENRERIDAGRVPDTLIDVLPAIAATWPTPARAPAREGQALLRIAIDALPAPTGDVFVTTVREPSHDVDIALPTFSLDSSRRWVSQAPSRLLRARQSRIVSKSVYRHEGWTSLDGALDRSLIDMAESDPHIAAYCLFDPLRQPWPRLECNDQDAPPACPRALVRTPGYVYVVQFVPYLPSVAMSETSSKAADVLGPYDPDTSGRDTVAAWCRRVNALPADRRQFREWRPVQVQAPLFWSWKRRGGTLSSLLSALADTTPIAMRRPRIAQPLE